MKKLSRSFVGFALVLCASLGQLAYGDTFNGNNCVNNNLNGYTLEPNLVGGNCEYSYSKGAQCPKSCPGGTVKFINNVGMKCECGPQNLTAVCPGISNAVISIPTFAPPTSACFIAVKPAVMSCTPSSVSTQNLSNL